MSDFDTRPTGTVMYGAFDAFAQAERALRVLKNAGYARASFESGDAEERTSAEPAVVVVDAAAAGARRAAEILEEHGAQIRFMGDRVAPKLALMDAPEASPLVISPANVPLVVASAEGPLTFTSAEVPLAVTSAEIPLVAASGEIPLGVLPVERKPRVRRRVRNEAQRAVTPQSSVPNDVQDVVIVTRTFETVINDGR